MTVGRLGYISALLDAGRNLVKQGAANWTGAGATLPDVGTRLQVLNTSSYGYGWQGIPTTIGKKYRLSFMPYKNTSGAAGYRLGSSAPGQLEYGASGDVSTPQSFDITATSVTLFVSLYTFEAATGNAAQFDAIRCIQIP